MPVYRLMPVAGSELSPAWRASSMRPYCLWILASNETEARRQAARATAVMRQPGEPDSPAPWQNAGLVVCESDTAKSVAAGVIHVRRQPYCLPPPQEPHRARA